MHLLSDVGTSSRGSFRFCAFTLRCPLACFYLFMVLPHNCATDCACAAGLLDSDEVTGAPAQILHGSKILEHFGSAFVAA